MNDTDGQTTKGPPFEESLELEPELELGSWLMDQGEMV